MFRYKTTWVDDTIEEVTTESGIVTGKDYGEAANRVVAFYGKERVITIALTELVDILTEDNIIDEFKEE